MDAKLRSIHKHMLDLGLGALAHANWHANYQSHENEYWNDLSVLQAAHAAEILIKARIAKEHPLLIFEHLPKASTSDAKLDLDQLIEHGRTYQYSDLPGRLWAATGIQIPNLKLYQSFGRLRNAIQHFTLPNRDVGQETIEFIFGVIDPFINECWGLYAVDYNEDHEPYIYFVNGLIRRAIRFEVSPGVIENLDHTDLEWPEGNPHYKTEMLARIENAKSK